MTKNESIALKGVAILLMLFYHLFNQMENCELCIFSIEIGSVPLVYYFTRFANPVEWYLILGGYGMYFVSQKDDKHRFSRIINLVVHAWFIMTFFVGLGMIIKPVYYPGSFRTMLESFLFLKFSYNQEWWFLTPYVILSLVAKPWFAYIKRFNWKTVALVTFLISIFSCFVVSRYGDLYLYPYFLQFPFLCLILLFPFTVGGLACRESFLQYRPLKSSIAVIVLLLLIAIHCFYRDRAFYYLYALVCIWLLLQIRFPLIIEKILIKIGNQSMNMWLIHSWFCYYLFHDELYGLKYPLLIYIVLVLVSFICSHIVDFILNPIIRKICIWLAL